MSDESRKKPITFRDGAVFAKIWLQDGQHGPYPSVEIGRTFQTEAGEWGASSSFGRNDLLKLQALMPQVDREVVKIQTLLKQQTQGQQAEPPVQEGLQDQLDEALAHVVEPAPAQATQQQSQTPE